MALQPSRFTESDARVIQNEVFLPPEAVQENDLDNELEEEIFQTFSERSTNILANNEYERSGTDPGLVVIFNQQTFESERFKKRTGTNRDANELILTFGRLGYNVKKKHVHNNLTRIEILNELEKISQKNHSDRNSLIIIILTHGNSGDMLQAKDAPLFTHEIWQPFSHTNCRTLRNKPKFFIFQACKGDSFSQTDDVTEDVIPVNTFTMGLERDMLLAFATVEGSQSYRHMYNGTWFIQELCRNFTAFGRRDDVLSLLIRTTKCVANNYYHITEQDSRLRKQMPLFISTLRKKFYLNWSKDRRLLVQILDNQQKILKELEEMREKINAMNT